MKVNEIQELLNFISSSGLDEVNIETENLKISVKRAGAAPVIQYATAPAPVAAPAPAQAAAPPKVAEPVAPAPKVETNADAFVQKSSMIGTFYRSPSPDKPAFVNIGDEVKKGQIICIIEAMKLFNEIEADADGKIVEILVENATPVEYEQPLFKIAKV